MENNFKNFSWDTSDNPINYPLEIKKKFFHFNIKRRKYFTEWLGLISKKYSKNIDWWFKIPSTRDPFISNLYKNLLIIEILKDKKIKNKIKYLTVDSKSLFSVILKNKIFDTNKLKLKEKIEKRSLVKYILFSIVIFFLIKLFSKKKNLEKVRHISLIDTFSDYRFKKDDLVYPGLEKNLKRKPDKNFYFVPNFFPSKNIFNIIRNIQFFSRKNYVFKENFLNLSEYIFCMKKTLKKKMKIDFANYKNINVAKIINEELDSYKHFHSEFLARVNLQFARKLKEKNIDVKKTINRFENQPMDKGWNYGFRFYFPKADVIGYQGFFYYPHFPHQSPTVYEQKAKVVPEKIIVTGKAFKKPRLEFNKKTKILLGPSLGKQHFLKKTKKKYQYKFVLALCGVKVVDEKMLEWSLNVLRKNQNITLVIKPHPILSIDNIINKYSQKIKKQIIFSNEAVDKLLEKSEIVISSGPTSIILESLVYGCKLFYLILDPNDSVYTKKIPFSKKYLEFIKNENELLKLMIKFNKKKFVKKDNNLKNYLFTKKNEKNIKLFF